MEQEKPDDARRPDELINEQWSSTLMGMAAQIQKARKAMHPALVSVAERAAKFAESPEYAELKLIAEGIIDAEAQAKSLSEMMRSPNEDIASIQKYLTTKPISALTLLALVSSERKQEAGELEKRIATETKAAKTKQAEFMAQARWADDEKMKAKAEILEWWKKWQNNPVMYKKKKDFDAAMLDKYPVIEDGRTVSKWRTLWQKQPPN